MKKTLLNLLFIIALLVPSLVWAETNTKEFVFSAQGYSDAADLTTVVVDNNITLTFGKGTNNSSSPKYYNSGTSARIYANNTMAVTAAEGVKIISIDFTYASGTYKWADGAASVGTVSDGNWTAGNDGVSSVLFTNNSTSQVRIQKFVIKYDGDAGSGENPGGGDQGEEPGEEEPGGEGDDAGAPIDVLTNADLGGGYTQSTYDDFTVSGKPSGAEYSINCAGSYTSIQLRSDNSKAAAGIISTVSGGTLKKVTITFNTNTAANRQVNIYASNTAYATLSDLYATEATPVGNVKYDGTTATVEYTFDGAYQYIGLRSNSGALYLAEVKIEWTGEGGGENPGGEEPGGEPGEEEIVDITYDFANNSYGETVFDSNNSSGYSEDGTILTEGAVSLEINPTETGSGCRFWNTGSVQQFRIMKNSSIRLFVTEGVITDVSFAGGSLQAEGATSASTTWSGSAESILFTNTTGGTVSLTAAKVTYKVDKSDTRLDAGLSFAETTATATIGAEFTAPALTKATSATVKYTSSNEAVATVNATTGVVTLVAAGKTTITAEAEANEQYKAGKASYTLTVNPNLNDALTVAEALDLIDSGAAPDAEVLVKGVISAIDEISTSYGNATYDIVDKGQSDALKIYRGYWLDGAKFTSADQLAVGAEVVVSGKLVNYNGTYEMTTGSKVISYTYEGGGEEPEQPEKPGEGDDDDKDATEVTFDFANNSYGETVFDNDNSSGYSEVGTILTEGAVSLEINPTETGSGCRFWNTGSAQQFRIMKNSSIRLFVGENQIMKSVTFAGGKLAVGEDAAANSWSGSAQSIQFTNTTTGTVSLTSITVKYITETSAELIEVENAPVEYFNLQGVRVDKPENGLYIRRQGSSVAKVFVK